MYEELYTEDEIHNLVDIIADKINELPRPRIHIIMKGGFMFGADLVRRLREPESVQFIEARSGYNPRTERHYPICGYPIYRYGCTNVLVDVVAEEGLTFELLQRKHVMARAPKIVTCALIVKSLHLDVDIFGSRYILDHFLEGYGMGPRRDLPCIVRRVDET